MHHLGMQVSGLHELDARMVVASLNPNPIREDRGSGYFMLEAPDGVLLEVFEAGPQRDEQVLRYYGLATTPPVAPAS